MKPIPKFKTEDEERHFWHTHDTTEYFDSKNIIKKVVFPNLKPTSVTTTVRFPVSILDSLKVQANKRDVPYQSLLKMIITDWLAHKN
jgi:predicted DNA binding CopG/RHH family protein